MMMLAATVLTINEHKNHKPQIAVNFRLIGLHFIATFNES